MSLYRSVLFVLVVLYFLLESFACSSNVPPDNRTADVSDSDAWNDPFLHKNNSLTFLLSSYSYSFFAEVT